MSHELATLYDCQDIIRQVEAIAADNDGELTEEQVEQLIKAETTTIAKFGKLARYRGFLNGYIDRGQAEIERIHKLLKAAENRRNSVERFLTPFVEMECKKLGRPIDCGTHRLSTRHTQEVVITDPESFAVGGFPNESRSKTIHQPDKEKIKAYIKEHGAHPGAEVRENVSLIIK